MAQFWLEHSFPPLPSHLEYRGISTNGYQSPTVSLLDGKCDNLVELFLSNFALFSEHPACPRLQRLKLRKDRPLHPRLQSNHEMAWEPTPARGSAP
jgi:hypothetical protein